MSDGPKSELGAGLVDAKAVSLVAVCVETVIGIHHYWCCLCHFFVNFRKSGGEDHIKGRVRDGFVFNPKDSFLILCVVGDQEGPEFFGAGLGVGCGLVGCG